MTDVFTPGQDGVEPGIEQYTGTRRLDKLAQLSDEERKALFEGLVRELRVAEPTLTESAARFGAERMFGKGALHVEELTDRSTLFCSWLGYHEPQNAAVRYHRYLKQETAFPQLEPEHFASIAIKEGKHFKYLFAPRHVGRVFQWAYDTGSYRKPGERGGKIIAKPARPGKGRMRDAPRSIQRAIQ